VRSRLLLALNFLLSLALSVAFAVTAAQAIQVQSPLPQAGGGVIDGIAVRGNERIEPATVVSYLTVRPGDPFDPEMLDESLKRLFNTGLFADVSFSRQGNTLIINVTENPIINRIIFDGNDSLDNEELGGEVELRPRLVFTRAKVRADVERMLTLYRRSGRFAAVIEPKVVQLPQNRVDLIFEISEGPKSKIRRVNFIGNKVFSDSDLRDQLATQEARWWKIFASNDSFDPDRQAFDREQLRRFYLNNGYADFRVVSAVAELTPDRQDFIVTFVVDEKPAVARVEYEGQDELSLEDIKDVAFDPLVYEEGIEAAHVARTYPATVPQDMSVAEAMGVMENWRAERLPVVLDKESQKVAGMLDYKAVLHAYNACLLQAEAEHHGSSAAGRKR